VVEYLKAENAYLDTMMAHTRASRRPCSRDQGQDQTDRHVVPYRLDDYWYYVRYEEGKEYPVYCRKKGSLEGPKSDD